MAMGQALWSKAEWFVAVFLARLQFKQQGVAAEQFVVLWPDWPHRAQSGPFSGSDWRQFVAEWPGRRHRVHMVTSVQATTLQTFSDGREMRSPISRFAVSPSTSKIKWFAWPRFTVRRSLCLVAFNATSTVLGSISAGTNRTFMRGRTGARSTISTSGKLAKNDRTSVGCLVSMNFVPSERALA